MHQWTGTITLPGPCDSWTFYYGLCCRNNSTNISGASSNDIYVETVMNSQTDNCNNSAAIASQPIPYVCVNQPVNFSMTANDIDGDSLVYSFIPARDNGTTNLTYAGGYSFNAPIPGATIDPNTGLITFTPTVIGNFVFAVLIEEFDANGNLVGSVVQDFQFEVINCTNIVPSPPASGISNLTGAATMTGFNSIEMCEGDNACFDLIFTDNDASQILTVTSNIASVLPSATVNTSGTNPVTVSICYTAQPGDPAFSSVTFNVEDNACPIAAQSSYSISIAISQNCCLPPTISFVAPTCNASNGSATATGQGTGPWDYKWYLSSDTTNVLFSEMNVTTSTLTGMAPGNYTVIVTDANGCERNITVVIPNSGSVTAGGSTSPESCSGAGDGALSATATGGNDPYDFVVLNGAGTSVGSQNDIPGPFDVNNLVSGTYTIIVTDSVGCIDTTTLTVTANNSVVASASMVAETCFEYNDAQINASQTGGAAPITYIISGPVADTNSTGNFSNLPAGNYVVLVTDDNGCFDTTQVTIVNTPEVIASASASPSSGNPPLNVDFTNNSSNATSYFWDFGNGSTSTAFDPSATYITDSTYTVTLIASNGPCADTIQLTILVASSYLIMPNVFTPHGDGSNDSFHPDQANITEFNLVIYNRWGLVVAEVTDPVNGWNGKDKGGKLCADGTYFYMMTATGLDGRTYEQQGTVTLLGNK